MNNIKVVDDNLDKINIDKNINIEFIKHECLFSINEIKIVVLKSTNLDLLINLKKDTKLNFDIILYDDVEFSLNILTTGINGKIQYKYTLNNNSVCNVSKFQNIDSIKEMIIVSLNGENAKIDYNFKTISSKKETYDYHIFHNNKNTISNIKNNGVCILDGTIIYQVSSFVPKDITGCLVNQNNRIINLTDNMSKILPNLYIDCNDVSANHSALIGRFSDEEIFYLLSRGIDKKNAEELLITGFLMSDIKSNKLKNNIIKNIKKYWR